MREIEEFNSLASFFFRVTYRGHLNSKDEDESKSRLRKSLIKWQVIKEGDKIVFPLLREGLIYLKRRATEIKTELQPSIDNPVFAIWLLVINERMTHDLVEIFSQIGQPAWDVVCQALLDQRISIRLLAALILTTDPHPSPTTANNVKSALKNTNGKDKAVFDSGLLFLLAIALANSGGEQFETEINAMQKKWKLTREEYVRRSEITALIYLVESGFLK